MKRTLAFVAALVLIALVVVFWRQSGRRTQFANDGPAARVEAPAPATQTLERAPQSDVARDVVPELDRAAAPVVDDSAHKPTLSGLLLDDESSQPVPGAAVFAAPCGRVAPQAGPWTVIETGADGRFTLELQRDAPHWLWLDDGRFVPWHSWQNTLGCVSPGARDVVIRVRRIGLTRLHVVDAATREPVHRASLRSVYDRTPPPPGTRTEKIESWYGDPFASKVEYTEQPSDGFAVDLIEPARAVVVRAPGYSPQLAQLLPLSEQTLALAPTGGMRGAITCADGLPRTCSIWLRREPTNTRFDEQRVMGDRDIEDNGAFEFYALAAGAYDVFVSIHGLFEQPPLLVRSRVVVSPGRVTELGTIEVTPAAASVVVRVALPSGVTARDLDGEFALAVDGWPAHLAWAPDGAKSAGVFRAVRLPVRRAECSFPARSSVLAAPQFGALALVPGDTNELTLDLSTLPLCTLAVQVGHPRPGAHRLYVVYADGREQAAARTRTEVEPYVERIVVRGGERIVVEHCTNFGEVVAASAPITLPRTSERAIEVHVP